jgi:serine protease Do
MKVVRKSLAGLGLGIALSATYFVGSTFVKDVQFAHAQQQVDATRQQIANIQDMAAVYKAVGKAVEPSVVSIDVTKQVDAATMRRFFPDRNGDGQPDMPREQGTGSGVIVETDGKVGYIVTNNHVAGGATEMTITLHDGREITDAKVLGTDPKTDLAVVKIEAERLIPARWGNSESLEKGDVVMAFGSPFGYVGSMTHGIVSALHRQNMMLERTNKYAYENFIQVDAPINPGNSGGPLVDLQGQIIGINTAIATESGGWQGLGFAIPSNQAKFVYDQIRNKGKVVRGWLGVEIGDVSKQPELVASLGYSERQGVAVSGVMFKTPAAGKLEPGDVITAINGKQVETVTELRNQIAITTPGTEVKLNVFRSGKAQEIPVTLGEQPEDTPPMAAVTPPAQQNAPGQFSAQNLGLTGLASATPELTKQFNLADNIEGAVVTTVRNLSLAFISGLRQGDVITRIDDTPIKSADDAREILAKKDPNKGFRIFTTNKDGTRLIYIKAD